MEKKVLVEKEEHICKGKCPKCGSENLKYDAWELESIIGDSLYYPFTCKDCGCEGKEWYDMNYADTTINDEEDE